MTTHTTSTAWSWLPNGSIVNQLPITLSESEARELHQFFQHEYFNVGKWPHLKALLDRIARSVGDG